MIENNKKNKNQHESETKKTLPKKAKGAFDDFPGI